MGIFSRKRERVCQWQPDSDSELTCPASNMEDAMIAGPVAYGAQFWREDNEAGFVVWAYPRWHGRDCLVIGFRIDREVRDASSSWSGQEYYSDFTWSEWLETLDEADEAAREVARGLISGDRVAAEVFAHPDALARWFDWDGTGLR